MKENFEKNIEEIIEQQDCLLWGIEYLNEKKYPLVRVYIDSAQGPSINDCERVSKALEYEIGFDEYFGEKYTLEVSTPGIERKFFNAMQLSRYTNNKLKIKTKNPINNRKSFEGRLTKVVSNFIYLSVNDEKVKIDFNEIDICRLCPDFIF